MILFSYKLYIEEQNTKTINCEPHLSPYLRPAWLLFTRTIIWMIWATIGPNRVFTFLTLYLYFAKEPHRSPVVVSLYPLVADPLSINTESNKTYYKVGRILWTSTWLSTSKNLLPIRPKRILMNDRRILNARTTCVFLLKKL